MCFAEVSEDQILIPLPPAPWDSEPQFMWVAKPTESNNQSYAVAQNSGIYSASASSSTAQAAPFAPKRKKKPIKGKVGSIGVGFFKYSNTNLSYTPPYNGVTGPVALEGSTANFPLFSVPFMNDTAQGFVDVMKKKGWKLGFNKSDDKLRAIELKRDDLGIGGSNLFNSVNVGLLMGHGTYATALDSGPGTGQSFPSYLICGATNDLSNPCVRLSDFKFGGDLRWMGILACNILRDANYQSMKNKQVLPIGDTFHLLCSGSSVIYFNEIIGKVWAQRLTKSDTVTEAWFRCGTETYAQAKPGDIINDVYFRVAGWDSCFNDTLLSYTEPDPDVDSIDYRERKVYP